MSTQYLKFAATTALLTFLLVGTAQHAPAQSATAVPILDPTRLIGTYYEIARFPIKREKQCTANETVLYALGDRKNAFQIVTSCEVKQDYFSSWNKHGQLDKSGNGILKLRSVWPFRTPYWILAIAPDYTWALVGSPNHKSLWILSRTPTLPPDVLSSIKSQASAQGFNTANLISIPQHQTKIP